MSNLSHSSINIYYFDIYISKGKIRSKTIGTQNKNEGKLQKNSQEFGAYLMPDVLYH